MAKFNFHAAVNLLLVWDNKILLIKRANTSYFSEYYEGPAGHIDGNETVREAMAREANEEVGIAIDPKDMVLVHIIHRYNKYKDGGEYFEFYLTADKWQGEPVNKEPEKCHEVGWFPLDTLPENMVPKTKHAIEQWRLGNVFSELDWENRIK
ncbi:MAG: NUDIX domain-containing protein [Parcubacteria group bacterium]